MGLLDLTGTTTKGTTKMNTSKKAALIETYKHLNASLADEFLPETEARALRIQIASVQAEINELTDEG